MSKSLLPLPKSCSRSCDGVVSGSEKLTLTTEGSNLWFSGYCWLYTDGEKVGGVSFTSRKVTLACNPSSTNAVILEILVVNRHYLNTKTVSA